MNPTILSKLLDKPETYQAILDNYRGAFSLGVTRLPEAEGGLGLLLRVEDQNLDRFPRSVTIEGYKIPILVKGGFLAPSAL